MSWKQKGDYLTIPLVGVKIRAENLPNPCLATLPVR
jgi:hypothetical protein